jgi:hypothetical protein
VDLFVEEGSPPQQAAPRGYSDEPEQSDRALLIACALQHGCLPGRRATKNIFGNILLLLTFSLLQTRYVAFAGHFLTQRLADIKIETLNVSLLV